MSVGTSPAQHWGRDGVVVARALMLRPWLWWAAAGAVRRLARRGWWRRPPFLPLPGAAYWHFRLVTVFGGTGTDEALSAADVVTYLQWCRRSRPAGR
jgi:tRNA-dihydrouridine synthase